LVGTDRHPEQFAVAVTHTLGKRNSIKQRRLWHRQQDCSDNCTKNNSVTKRTPQISNCWGADAARVPCSAASPNTRTSTICRLRGSRWRGRQRQHARPRALPGSFRPRTHSVTVIFPPTPRPFTLRSYMDCANTGGTMNWPRLHDLIW